MAVESLLTGFGVTLVALLVAGGIAALCVSVYRWITADTEPTAEDDQSDPDVSDPDVVELPPLDVQSASLGGLQEMWRIWRHHRKRRNLAGKGYVQWLLLDDSYPRPKFVKPEYEGGGVPELDHDDQRYLFPPEAMLPSRQHGIRTIVHKRGDAMPINLDTPGKPAISADELEEYLNLRVTATPPSWWDQIDLDAQDMITYAIAGVIVLAILQSVFGGGF